MQLPSINLATDSLGLGGVFQGFTNAQGTEMCGSKPTCVSLGKNSNCAQRHREFAECRMKAIEAQNNAAMSMSMRTNAAAPQQPNPIVLIAVAAVVIIVLILLFKKK